MIPFNKPYLSGKETFYIDQVARLGKFAGNGIFTEQCQSLFTEKYGFEHCLLTTSCTDALEMAALLMNCDEQSEVIVPSFTFVSTALAFARNGAKIVFADSEATHPNVSPKSIIKKITPKTKAIVVVHYGGMSVEMEELKKISREKGIFLVEDAAHSIHAFGPHHQTLGTFGDLAVFSFHETKNIHCGEGGMLCLNNPDFRRRAEILWEKGTNRSAFFRGEVSAYEWVDTGSSFLASEISAAFLYAQLEQTERVTQRRTYLWKRYTEKLEVLAKKKKIKLPENKLHLEHNGHLFYLLCQNKTERDALIEALAAQEIKAVFHYQPLHQSQYYLNKHPMEHLPNAEYFSACLVRLPLFYELTEKEQDRVVQAVYDFYEVEIEVRDEKKIQESGIKNQEKRE